VPSIKHILFPYDFSERCAAAAPFVEAMARRFGSNVTLLTVAAPNWYIGEPAGPLSFTRDQYLGLLNSRIEDALRNELAGIPVTKEAEIGEPGAAITKLAHARQVDLIMMPTHGYGPFRRLLLGSVTAKVLHDAQCPVWTSAHANAPPNPNHVTGRNVLCAVDGTQKSGGLIRWAAEYAQLTGALLRTVHVIPRIEPLVDRQLNREFEQALLTEAEARIQGFLKQAALAAPLSIVLGDIADAIRDEARRRNADLLIIGRGTLQETLGRLRTNAHAIIRQAPCPVISV
jgi:nucleotide-binding universal stress UspA family protein